MKTLIIEKLPRILKNKKKLEKELDIKITNRGKEVFVEGKTLNEYIAEKVLDAIDFGFPIKITLLINSEDYGFQILNIKDYTKRKDFSRIRSRIIGKQGKTLATLSQLTKCFFELKGNEVGIIGHPEQIKTAQDSVIELIRGSKQANVYKRLEKHKPLPILDLGLKIKIKKK